MRYQFVSISTDTKDNFYSIITVRETPSLFKRLLGHRPQVRRFRGNCTVWHDMETGRRAGETGNSLHDLVVGSTLMESYLSKIWGEERKVAV